MRRQVILASAAALLVAACSGDGGAAPSSSDETTTTSVSETTPETTVPSTTTTLSATTTSPTTTVPATTAVPTSDVTTTTTLPEGVPPRVTFPDDPDKQAVVDAAYAFFDAARAAQAAPDDQALRARLAETMVDPLSSTITAFLDALRDDGVRVIGGSEHPTYLDVVALTVEAVGVSGTLDACSIDGDVRVTRDGTFVSGNIGSAFVTYSLALDRGKWRVRDVTVFSRYPGEIGCG